MNLHFLMKRAAIPLLLTCFTCSGGCLYIPTPEHGLLEGRGAFSEQRVAFIKDGSTTQRQVLLDLGEPDWTFEDERVFIYRWTVIQGYLIVGYSGSDIPRGYLLLVQFDDNGVVRRHERKMVECMDTFQRAAQPFLDAAASD